jgi:predicted Holliday junction resolvase-like endonuclease
MEGMAQTTAQRQRAYKESMKESGYVRLEAYVTKEQRDKFRALGGDEWLRKRINAAKRPSP